MSRCHEVNGLLDMVQIPKDVARAASVVQQSRQNEDERLEKPTTLLWKMQALHVKTNGKSR